MTRFLVETYTPAAAAIADIGARARSVENAVSRAAEVRYLRSFFVPADETCFHMFDARSAEALRQAIEQAGLSPDRIVEVQNWPATNEGGQPTEGIS